MRQFDAVVIGGGVLGCFTARNLRRWNISTLLIEAEEDVCTGITRANTAIVYAGYDNKPGSLKAGLTVQGNRAFDRLCAELDVPFRRPGSLMVCFGPNGDRTLRKKLEQGRKNGVPGLRLVPGAEALEMEPMLSPNVTSALFAPTTGTVNPWQLGIAAWENALLNGCETMRNTRVLGIRKLARGYIIETSGASIECGFLLNCAGAYAGKVQEMLFPSSIRLDFDGADFLILDAHAPKPEHIIFHEAEDGKGITAVPCVEGNLLLDSPPRPLTTPFATTHEGMKMIRDTVRGLLPELDLTQVIRSFGALRPNPRVSDGRSIPDFGIESPAPNFISLIGIKTPGLTCANELGMLLARKAADYLGAEQNSSFDPRRKSISQQDHEIICQCGHITRGEILEAVARGAVTVDGIKRRVGSGMGRCQGSRCRYQMELLLEEWRRGTL